MCYNGCMKTLFVILISFALCLTAAAQTKTHILIEVLVGTNVRTYCNPFGWCTTMGGPTDYSLHVTEALMDRCPDIVTVTQDPDAADYRLRLQEGDAVLFNNAGEAVHVSRARIRVKNFAKDLCGYIRTLPK